MERNIYADILFGENQNTASGINCEQCRSSNVNVFEQQTRSSDEPVTLFITCRDCKYVSVDMGN